MENVGGFASWAPPAFSSPYSSSSSPIAAAAAASSASSCSLFPDQLLVPAIGTTSNGAHQFLYHHQPQPQHQHQHQQKEPHPRLTCLKLGKRQYYGGGGGAEAGMVGGKRERASVTSSMATMPRCQVEGCNKALIDAKDYHRRHKVCEMHSKAPKVVVLGSEQRFCQQCSRFHAISEFDDSKRSCRRRLAGHNERRRKSNGDSIIRNPTSSATALETTIMGSRFPYLSQTSPGRALSLLSSKSSPWIPTPELSSRSSAALRELIAENRAALLGRQLVSNSGWHSVGYSNQSIISFASPENQEASRGTAQLLNGWNQFQESGSQLTLDLMQSLNSTSFELLSGKNNKSKEDDDECCEIWKSLQGTHVL